MAALPATMSAAAKAGALAARADRAGASIEPESITRAVRRDRARRPGST